jgi:effector-binding domain-containing protein
MLDTPKITTTEAMMTAMIHVTTPRSEIQKVMGPGLKELQAALDAQGIKATGPWFTHHLKMDPKVFDFEICLPVAAPVKATGRVKPGRVPALKAARTVYHGGYEGLGSAWGEFNEWIDSHALTPAGDLWECYVAGPESGPDPAKWQTELTRPLRG